VDEYKLHEKEGLTDSKLKHENTVFSKNPLDCVGMPLEASYGWRAYAFLHVARFLLMPFCLVYMETFSIDFLTPSFVIYISKHRHHQGC
jgi:hypothetical protein